MPNEKDVSIKIGKHIKKLVVTGSQLMKQSEKTFIEKAVEEHHKKLEKDKSIIEALQKNGLI
jgi:hypothetical protein